LSHFASPQVGILNVQCFLGCSQSCATLTTTSEHFLTPYRNSVCLTVPPSFLHLLSSRRSSAYLLSTWSFLFWVMWPSVTRFLHLVCVQDSSMLESLSVLHFYCSGNILAYGYVTFYFSIHQLEDFRLVFSLYNSLVSVFTVTQPSLLSIFTAFHQLRREPHTHPQSLAVLPSPLILASTGLPSVPMVLPILGVSYKWNHPVCGLL
jgi:hypothetical protein